MTDFPIDFKYRYLTEKKKKRQNCATWELWVKLYLGQNDHHGPEDSISACSGYLFWRARGRCTYYMTLVMELKWVKLLSRVRLFATPWTVACQVPPSMGFSRQAYWSGLPFPSPRDLSNPGIEPGSPTLQADSTIWATRGYLESNTHFGRGLLLVTRSRCHC